MRRITYGLAVLLVFVGMVAAAQNIPVTLPSWCRDQMKTVRNNEAAAGLYYPTMKNGSEAIEVIVDSVTTAANVSLGTLVLKQPIYGGVIMEKIGLSFGFNCYKRVPTYGVSRQRVAIGDSTVYVCNSILKGIVYLVAFDSTAAHTYYVVGHPTEPKRW